MPAIIHTNAGERLLLDVLKAYFNTLVMNLYTNDHDPECEDDDSSYTPGLGSDTTPTWAAATEQTSGAARIQLASDVIFTNGGGTTTFYGVEARDPGDDTLICVSQFDESISLENGDIFNITEIDIWLWNPICPPECLT